MKTIKSLITMRHGCPENPAYPIVDLVEGGTFEVTDAMAAHMIKNGTGELVEVEAEGDVKVEEPKAESKTINVLKGRLGK